jgi:hypothetical protein
LWTCWDIVLIAYIIESALLLRLLATSEGSWGQEMSMATRGERELLLASWDRKDEAERTASATRGYRSLEGVRYFSAEAEAV